MALYHLLNLSEGLSSPMHLFCRMAYKKIPLEQWKEVQLRRVSGSLHISRRVSNHSVPSSILKILVTQ